MGAIDLVRSLMAEGVEFATDGSRVRWRNSGGRMTPETVARLAADKPEVIEFLTRERSTRNALHPDAVAYLDFLRREGPVSYGAAATTLNWPATRAWRAEARLRAAGLVRYDELGRAHAKTGADTIAALTQDQARALGDRAQGNQRCGPRGSKDEFAPQVAARNPAGLANRKE